MEVSTLSHLTNSALVVYGLQLLKGTLWYRRLSQALPIAEGKVHFLMSLVGAAASSLGMHGAVEGSIIGGYQLTLAIPPIWVVLHAMWDTVQQLALNQILFALAIQQKQAAPVATVPVGQGISVTAAIPETPITKG